MEVKEIVSNRIIQNMNEYLDVQQLNKLKLILTVNLAKFRIEEAKNEVIIYDETSDIAAYKQYFVALKLRGLADGTIRLAMRTIDKFNRTVRKPYKDITTNDIRIYMANRDMQDRISKATLSRECGAICRFFKWLHAEEYISKDPGLRVEKIKVETRLKRAFTPVEVELIRNATLKEKEKAVIELLLSTGCRVSELISLTLENYDYERGSIPVVGKGDKERTTFVNAKAKVAVDNYLLKTGHTTGPIIKGQCENGGMSTSGIQKMIKTIEERAKIGHAHPHKFRRTAATLALRHGMDINDVRIFLGHADMNTTLRYLDMTGVDFKQLHDKYLN